MPEFWETAFQDKQLMWGEERARSALFARDYFRARGARDLLIPGFGYGRNARPFLEAGMSVTGIELSQTAIDLARSRLGRELVVHHGSVAGMPFDDRQYDGVFCYALIHLLDEAQRARLIADCHAQLRPGGHLIFTALSKDAPTYGAGTPIGRDRFEMHGGARLFFYDEASVLAEFGPYGVVEWHRMGDHSNAQGGTLPFFVVVCGGS